ANSSATRSRVEAISPKELAACSKSIAGLIICLSRPDYPIERCKLTVELLALSKKRRIVNYKFSLTI
ncbi:hypothetical protein QT972_27080, partial [Microcoleus sp. herbarium7]|uniref:hypothetical protein n=1 Tax=Microcoleus sp. herbarium7 TaxID=3055435 RepID=UPI002FCF3A84